MKGSNVYWCFDNYLFSLPDFIEDSQDPFDKDVFWTEEDPHNLNNQMEAL